MAGSRRRTGRPSRATAQATRISTHLSGEIATSQTGVDRLYLTANRFRSVARKGRLTEDDQKRLDRLATEARDFLKSVLSRRVPTQHASVHLTSRSNDDPHQTRVG